MFDEIRPPVRDPEMSSSSLDFGASPSPVGFLFPANTATTLSTVGIGRTGSNSDIVPILSKPKGLYTVKPCRLALAFDTFGISSARIGRPTLSA